MSAHRITFLQEVLRDAVNRGDYHLEMDVREELTKLIHGPSDHDGDDGDTESDMVPSSTPGAAEVTKAFRHVTLSAI